MEAEKNEGGIGISLKTKSQGAPSYTQHKAGALVVQLALLSYTWFRHHFSTYVR